MPANHIPAYVYQYPPLVDAALLCRDLIVKWEQMQKTVQPNTGQLELELRLGTMDGSGFVPGITAEFAEFLVGKLDSFAGWAQVDDWNVSHDYFYPISNDSSQNIRTTTHFVRDKKTNQAQLHLTHCAKWSIEKMDFQCYNSVQPDGQMQTVRDGQTYDVRVALNYESKINPQDLSDVINPQYVRIKSRKSYFYVSKQSPSSKVTWRFDVTKTWSGKTFTQADENQAHQSPIYEFELECVDPSAIMIGPQYDHLYVAVSMFLKILDFFQCLGQGCNFRWLPVK